MSFYSFAGKKSLIMDVKPLAVSHTEIDIRLKKAVETDHTAGQALLLMYTRSLSTFQLHLELQK